jgi:hypothetical protein
MADIPRVSWTEVCARRLDRHALSTPSVDAGPADIAAAISGAHAQVMSAAELSIGLRIAGATRVDIRHALWTERSLVKTFGPRGTVHLLPSQDLPMWTGAFSALPRPQRGFPPNVRLTPEQTDEVIAAIATALDDAELTIDELDQAVVTALGSWAGELVMPAFNGLWPRWRQTVDIAAHRGALCFGPNRGNKITYTSPRRWLPGFHLADGPTALAELVRRYLASYGPATPQQFARWLGITPRQASDVFDTLIGDLQAVDLAGAVAWLPVGDTVMPSSPSEGVRLLPYFDAYVVGCHPRELVFPGVAATRALARTQAGNYPVLLVDGVAAGVWHQRRSGRKIAVTVEPFHDLTPKQRRELDEQVERIGEILEGTPTLTIGPVNVGPHA